MLNKTDRKFHWAWLSEHNAVLKHDMAVICKLLSQVEGNQFVDLGCFIGGFTVPMAMVAKERGGKVYSVDLYKSAIPTPGNFYNEHLNYPCKEYFIENMKSVGLIDVIDLYEAHSWDVSRIFKDESVDFIWVDADHHYESVKKDIDYWYPKLKKGGIIAGHDYTEEGVRRAVWEFFPCYTVWPTRNDCWSFKKENI